MRTARDAIESCVGDSAVATDILATLAFEGYVIVHDDQIAREKRQAAAKKLYEHIALQGNTVTITDVEAGYLARLLDEA